MPDDLPIYPDNAMLRTGLQFADLIRYRSVDNTAIWIKSEQFIAGMEGAVDVARARQELIEPTKEGFLRAHAILFAGRAGAGELRHSQIVARYRGQDCPEPEFLDRSLTNFFNWMTAESVAEIHPIEKAALVMTRIADVWPFEFGNLTAAVVLGNAFLRQAGLPPFFLLPGQLQEFETIMAQAVAIETQPLVNVIHKTIKREIEAIAG
jgi:hypothetical protein